MKVEVAVLGLSSLISLWFQTAYVYIHTYTRLNKMRQSSGAV